MSPSRQPALVGFWAMALGLWQSKLAAAQPCPGGGHSAHGRCWYLSDIGQSCSARCAGAGLQFSWFVAGEQGPMLPKILGREPSRRQGAWGRLECFVEGEDRYHTAGNAVAGGGGDSGGPGDWAYNICRLACPCSSGDLQAFPDCAEPGTVMRHAGEHGIFVDASEHGVAGCWQNNCKDTDKFIAEDMGICARACTKSAECTHWTFGEQEGAKKCFLRKGDGGREQAEGWYSGAKECAPKKLPDHLVALHTSELPALAACEAGRSDTCPDMARAAKTWKFAIDHLQRATDGKLDQGTANFVSQIGQDLEAFESQMTEENFPVVMANNRQVFNALGSYLRAQPSDHKVDPSDPSLPNPMRGSLCGPGSCYERI